MDKDKKKKNRVITRLQMNEKKSSKKDREWRMRQENTIKKLVVRSFFCGYSNKTPETKIGVEFRMID